MSSGTILALYIAFFAAEFAWERLLTLLNMRHVQRNRDSVPQPFEGYVDIEKHSASADYTLTRSRFSLVTASVSSVFLLTLILTGLLGSIDAWLGRLPVHRYVHGILYVLALSLVFRLVSLPFGLYSQFVIEEKFGFNRMTVGLFFVDLLKGILISLVLMVPLLLGLFWFMDTTGGLWWIYAFLFVTTFQFVVSILYPLVIAPVFNKFTPLEEGSLRQKIIALADKLAFATRGIVVMDGSKRTKHANAYLAGLGRVKRVVLFDTLLDSLEEEQVAAVLAHEIGHAKKRHRIRMLAVSLALSLASLFVVSQLLAFAPLFEAFSFAQPSYHAILVILGFCSGPFTFFLSPLFSIWSRKHEYEADRFAVNAVGQAQDLKEALLRLEKENLANLTPHPLYSFYHYSHPTLAERIGALEQQSCGPRPGATDADSHPA